MAFGERGLPAEAVAETVAKEAQAFHDGVATVGEHLADQLVLPMALAGRGRFVTSRLSSHLLTNIATVEKFLAVKFLIEEANGGATVAL